jgi:hypothetical protein
MISAAEAARERRFQTWKLTTPKGLKTELWVSPERAEEIKAMIADGRMEGRTLKAEGRVFHQYIKVAS